MSKYERGHSTPSPFRLTALAEQLEMSVAELLLNQTVIEVAEPSETFVDLKTELLETPTRLDVAAQQKVLAYARRLAERAEPNDSGG